MQDAAARLEKAIATKTASAELAPLLREFQSTLDDFVRRLGAALPKTETIAAPAASDVALDADQARQVITEMIGHLNNFDPAAGDCLEANRDVFRTLLPGTAFTTFEEQLGSFAFADALAGLEHAAKEKGFLPA